jgi:hypothetical protein
MRALSSRATRLPEMRCRGSRQTSPWRHPRCENAEELSELIFDKVERAARIDLASARIGVRDDDSSPILALAEPGRGPSISVAFAGLRSTAARPLGDGFGRHMIAARGHQPPRYK